MYWFFGGKHYKVILFQKAKRRIGKLAATQIYLICMVCSEAWVQTSVRRKQTILFACESSSSRIFHLQIGIFSQLSTRPLLPLQAVGFSLCNL